MAVRRIDLERLSKTESWEWPENTAEELLDVLRSAQATEKDRLLAADLAGDLTVINDDLADALLAIASSDKHSEELRSVAAIALGPILDDADVHDDVSDLGMTEPLPVSDDKIDKIRATLEKVYRDTRQPELVRRRVLEASVRSPEEWHRDAIQEALAKKSDDWALTAIFCMRYINGFENEILKALRSKNNNVQYHAISAAGTWELEDAWSHIHAIIKDTRADKMLLIAAIEAAASIHPDDADELLGPLVDHDDEDIAAAAEEAIEMADAMQDWDEFDEDDDEDDDDRR